MNDELIKILMDERDKLYPNGCLIQPRGCGKTNLYLSHFLRWKSYDVCCEFYKTCEVEIPISQAHEDINDFVVGIMKGDIDE